MGIICSMNGESHIAQQKTSKMAIRTTIKWACRKKTQNTTSIK